jgi:hypothetical protein
MKTIGRWFHHALHAPLDTIHWQTFSRSETPASSASM